MSEVSGQDSRVSSPLVKFHSEWSVMIKDSTYGCTVPHCYHHRFSQKISAVCSRALRECYPIPPLNLPDHGLCMYLTSGLNHVFPDVLK